MPPPVARHRIFQAAEGASMGWVRGSPPGVFGGRGVMPFFCARSIATGIHSLEQNRRPIQSSSAKAARAARNRQPEGRGDEQNVCCGADSVVPQRYRTRLARQVGRVGTDEPRRWPPGLLKLDLTQSRSLGNRIGIALGCLQKRRAKRSQEATVTGACVLKIGFGQAELRPFQEKARWLVRMKQLGFAFLPIVVQAYSLQARLCGEDTPLFDAPFARPGAGGEVWLLRKWPGQFEILGGLPCGRQRGATLAWIWRSGPGRVTGCVLSGGRANTLLPACHGISFLSSQAAKTCFLTANTVADTLKREGPRAARAAKVDR